MLSLFRQDCLPHPLDAEWRTRQDRRLNLRAEVLVTSVTYYTQWERQIIVSQRFRNRVLNSRKGRLIRSSAKQAITGTLAHRPPRTHSVAAVPDTAFCIIDSSRFPSELAKAYSNPHRTGYFVPYRNSSIVRAA